MIYNSTSLPHSLFPSYYNHDQNSNNQ